MRYVKWLIRLPFMVIAFIPMNIILGIAWAFSDDPTERHLEDYYRDWSFRP